MEERTCAMTRETWLQHKRVAEYGGTATRESVRLESTLGATIALNAVIAHGPGAEVRMDLQHERRAMTQEACFCSGLDQRRLGVLNKFARYDSLPVTTQSLP
jgi:hypothetical protein